MNPPLPAALLIVDAQQGFDDPRWGTRNNPEAERRIATLLAAWRRARWPVVHVQHMSTEPDSPLRPELAGNAFIPEAVPLDGEPVFQKSVNSAFIGTALESHLHREGIGQLVIAGMTTDHCISTTVRMAGNLGFDVVLVEDATATFDRVGPDGIHYSADQVHRLALASLHGEFAQVKSSAEVLAQMTGPSGH
ncbi:MAG: cysteine hydrolase family protein [Gemmatimonadota bacterium]